MKHLPHHPLDRPFLDIRVRLISIYVLYELSVSAPQALVRLEPGKVTGLCARAR